MGESSISKSGKVSFQIKGLLKSSWQPRFLVLYNGSSDSHPHIDMYESQDKFKETKEASKKCEKKIDLNRVKYVNKSTQKSSSGVDYIIEIQCKKEKYIFSLTNEFEFNDWDYRLNKVVNVLPEKCGENSRSDTGDAEEVVTTNLMYEQTTEAIRFEVDVQEEKLALLCDIAGRHVLCVSDRELAFEEIGTRRIKYCFNFAWLRKFGKQNEIFFFECGRKCPNGEGSVHCTTMESSKLHDVVTSKSRSALESNKTPERVNSVPLQQVSAPVQQQTTSYTLPTNIDHDIGTPSLATNALRKHPGNFRLPELLPIRPRTGSSTTPPTPKKVIPDRKSVANNSKRDSVKKHNPASNEFTKELEHKILTHPSAEEAVKQSKTEEKHQKDLRRSKEKKKSDKEDKKGKEARKSDREGKKDKEEKKSKGFFSIGIKKKDKEEKPEEKPKAVLQDKLNLYEDPDEYIKKPTNKVHNSNDIYDEAISPVMKVPISEPVEYAQPYARKDVRNMKPNDAVMYSDVQDVQDRAWITHGQEEEVHDEDYLNIKAAREMKEKEMKGRENEPPPLPQKHFDLSDDTYNTLDLGNKPNKDSIGTQNIYGTAGAKAVGKLNKVAVQERPSVSESEGSSGDLYEPSDEEEELNYDDNGCGYEETVLARTNSAPKKAQPSHRINTAMYEEIPSPPPTSSVRKKQAIPQESVYDEVS